MENQLQLALKNNKLLNNIDLSEIKLDSISGKLKTLKEGQILYKQGDKSNSIFLVISGEINLLLKRPSEKTKSQIIGEGEYLGFDELRVKSDRQTMAVALTDCYLIILSKKEVQNLLDQNQKISENLICVFDEFQNQEIIEEKKKEEVDLDSVFKTDVPKDDKKIDLTVEELLNDDKVEKKKQKEEAKVKKEVIKEEEIKKTDEKVDTLVQDKKEATKEVKEEVDNTKGKIDTPAKDKKETVKEVKVEVDKTKDKVDTPSKEEAPVIKEDLSDFENFNFIDPDKDILDSDSIIEELEVSLDEPLSENSFAEEEKSEAGTDSVQEEDLLSSGVDIETEFAEEDLQLDTSELEADVSESLEELEVKDESDVSEKKKSKEKKTVEEETPQEEIKSEQVETEKKQPESTSGGGLNKEHLSKLTETFHNLNSNVSLDELLTNIVKTAVEISNADRGTLYMVDDEKKIIYSKITSGGRLFNIELQLGKGIAGWVAKNNQHLRLDNAPSDDRFNPEIDQQSGFSTKSMLCYPIVNRSKKVIGVLQLLNSKDGDFTNIDELFIDVLSTQAAIAIENSYIVNQLVQSERNSSLDKMINFLINDIKKPILVAKRYAEHLHSKELNNEATQIVNMLLEQVNKISDQVQSTTNYAEDKTVLRKEKISIRELLDDFITKVEPYISSSKVELTKDYNIEVFLKIDRKEMFHAFNHIIKNACEAMPEGGKLIIKTEKSQGFVKIFVKDTGLGIPPTIHSNVFDIFFSHGKKEGTGLGLAIAKKVIEEHGGNITFSSEIGEGATFEISLPVGMA